MPYTYGRSAASRKEQKQTGNNQQFQQKVDDRNKGKSKKKSTTLTRRQSDQDQIYALLSCINQEAARRWQNLDPGTKKGLTIAFYAFVTVGIVFAAIALCQALGAPLLANNIINNTTRAHSEHGALQSNQHDRTHVTLKKTAATISTIPSQSSIINNQTFFNSTKNKSKIKTSTPISNQSNSKCNNESINIQELIDKKIQIDNLVEDKDENAYEFINKLKKAISKTYNLRFLIKLLNHPEPIIIGVLDRYSYKRAEVLGAHPNTYATSLAAAKTIMLNYERMRHLNVDELAGWLRNELHPFLIMVQNQQRFISDSSNNNVDFSLWISPALAQQNDGTFWLDQNISNNLQNTIKKYFNNVKKLKVMLETRNSLSQNELKELKMYVSLLKQHYQPLMFYINKPFSDPTLAPFQVIINLLKSSHIKDAQYILSQQKFPGNLKGIEKGVWRIEYNKQYLQTSSKKIDDKAYIKYIDIDVENNMFTQYHVQGKSNKPIDIAWAFVNDQLVVENDALHTYSADLPYIYMSKDNRFEEASSFIDQLPAPIKAIFAPEWCEFFDDFYQDKTNAQEEGYCQSHSFRK